ncbi:MAG: hypothetical protein GY849_17255 [Deltaproteobacteria bacterium]|nr:hypothetical protein [Deltaproteobacteria bacterium]
MKKFFLVCMVAALTLAVAAPALAGLKLTSKGRMDVSSIWVSNDVINRPTTTGNDYDNDDPAAWYQQELVIDPVLHVNEKVKIHARFTIMERLFMGGSGGEFDANNQGMGVNGDYRDAHNFWVERVWLSFPLFGGTLHVGRMPGGSWAYPWQNWDANRDRIKYVRKFGHIVMVGLIEKLAENDAGNFVGAGDQLAFSQSPPLGYAADGNPYDNNHSDIDAYAVGAIAPFSRNIIWRPLVYYVNFGNSGISGKGHGYDLLILNGLMIKAGIFRLDMEINWRNRCWTKFFYDGDEWHDWETSQWSGWMEAGLHPGPFSIVAGAFYLQGTRSGHQGTVARNRSLWGVGAEFQPLLLLFSEDMGILWNTTGVANGTNGGSGYVGGYLRGAYKINDTMTLSAIVGNLWADTMYEGTAATDHNGRIYTASRHLGFEADLAFEWKFMDNLKWVIDLGYFWAGPFFDNWSRGGPAMDIFGVRNMLVIEW